MSEFDHLVLPKTDIELPRRGRPTGFGRTPRGSRGSHGQRLREQASQISQSPRREASPFRLNPKLIFKLQLRSGGYLAEENLSPMGLTLLAQESSTNKAIVVFSDDEQLEAFRDRLQTYSSDSGHIYAELDEIEELVALEPSDRLGRLLELEPVQEGELAALDVELWHTGSIPEMRQYLEVLDEFLRESSEDLPMRVSDHYVSDYLCLARVKITLEMLDFLLEEEFVKEIDRRPRPSFETPQLYSVTLNDLPEVLSPPEENCGVLVIDSGVQAGHPLIGPALGEAEVFPDRDNRNVTGGPEDGDSGTPGHGTGVSGIAIYGNVSQCIQELSFQPDTWLFSARVTNENNEYDPDELLENQLRRAVEYFINDYPNCKVINISLGDKDLVYQQGQKQFSLAALIDELAYEYQHNNLVFVISAGNFRYSPESDELLRQEYPHYLLSEAARIIEPATAAIALTVGSLSAGAGSAQFSDDAGQVAIARVTGYPSPFTRTGFGVDEMIKPEFVDFGGDFVLSRGRVLETAEVGVSVLTLAKNFRPSLFRAFCGTSFAAPRVANIAARLFTEFPSASSNLIRALIADSAEYPVEKPEICCGETSQPRRDRLKIYGYGQPDLERAKFSTENRVVLLEDNVQIPVGRFQMYEIPPLPEDFLTVRGKRTISVTLAFTPPTRPTRGDSYLGVTMEFHLFKKINPAIINNVFVKASESDSPESFTEINFEELEAQHGAGCRQKLKPGVNQLKKGTLQKGYAQIGSMTGPATSYDQNPLYLVICCNRKWAKLEEISTLQYALVVSLSHSSNEVDIYNQIRLRTRVNSRLRIR